MLNRIAHVRTVTSYAALIHSSHQNYNAKTRVTTRRSGEVSPSITQHNTTHRHHIVLQRFSLSTPAPWHFALKETHSLSRGTIRSLCKQQNYRNMMLQTVSFLVLAATSANAFVQPMTGFNRMRASATSSRAASSLAMGEEPLGVGVIGCGRIGDVSNGRVGVLVGNTPHQ